MRPRSDLSSPEPPSPPRAARLGRAVEQPRHLAGELRGFRVAPVEECRQEPHLDVVRRLPAAGGPPPEVRWSIPRSRASGAIQLSEPRSACPTRANSVSSTIVSLGR